MNLSKILILLFNLCAIIIASIAIEKSKCGPNWANLKERYFDGVADYPKISGHYKRYPLGGKKRCTDVVAVSPDNSYGDSYMGWVAKISYYAFNFVWPDQASTYWACGMDAFKHPIYVIKGSYAHARYFGFFTYASTRADRVGQKNFGQAYEWSNFGFCNSSIRGNCAGLIDMNLEPDKGSKNPFCTSKVGDNENTYTLYIVSPYYTGKLPNSKNILPMCPYGYSQGVLLYRVYAPFNPQSCTSKDYWPGQPFSLKGCNGSTDLEETFADEHCSPGRQYNYNYSKAKKYWEGECAKKVDGNKVDKLCNNWEDWWYDSSYSTDGGTLSSSLRGMDIFQQGWIELPQIFAKYEKSDYFIKMKPRLDTDMYGSELKTISVFGAYGYNPCASSSLISAQPGDYQLPQIPTELSGQQALSRWKFEGSCNSPPDTVEPPPPTDDCDEKCEKYHCDCKAAGNKDCCFQEFSTCKGSNCAEFVDYTDSEDNKIIFGYSANVGGVIPFPNPDNAYVGACTSYQSGKAAVIWCDVPTTPLTPGWDNIIDSSTYDLRYYSFGHYYYNMDPPWNLRPALSSVIDQNIAKTSVSYTDEYTKEDVVGTRVCIVIVADDDRDNLVIPDEYKNKVTIIPWGEVTNGPVDKGIILYRQLLPSADFDRSISDFQNDQCVTEKLYCNSGDTEGCKDENTCCTMLQLFPYLRNYCPRAEYMDVTQPDFSRYFKSLPYPSTFSMPKLP